jgi:hypothetical protein
MDKPFTDKTLDDIIQDLSHFIMREIIPLDGDYCDKEATCSNPQTLALSDIAGLNLSRDSY